MLVSDMPVLEVVVIDRDTGKPVSFGVMVCVGDYCSPTGFNGVARLVIPSGTYTLTVGGGAYDIVRKQITVTTDKRIRVILRRILL